MKFHLFIYMKLSKVWKNIIQSHDAEVENWLVDRIIGRCGFGMWGMEKQLDFGKVGGAGVQA